MNILFNQWAEYCGKITYIYIFLFCSWAATFYFICSVLSNPNRELKKIMSIVSFQDSFNQVITGKKTFKHFSWCYLLYQLTRIWCNKAVTNLKAYLQYVLKVTSYIHIHIHKGNTYGMSNLNYTSFSRNGSWGLMETIYTWGTLRSLGWKAKGTTQKKGNYVQLIPRTWRVPLHWMLWFLEINHNFCN